jgi:hypothetical protein
MILRLSEGLYIKIADRIANMEEPSIEDVDTDRYRASGDLEDGTDLTE